MTEIKDTPRLPTLLDNESAKSQGRDPAARTDIASQVQHPHQEMKVREASVRASEVQNQQTRTDPEGRQRAEARKAGVDAPPPGLAKGEAKLDALLDRLGLSRGADGTLHLQDSVTLQALPGMGGKSLAEVLPGLQTLPTQGPPPIYVDPTNPAALAAFTDALGRGLDDVMVQTAGQPSLIDKISADTLTATFMKLNIEDQLDSAATRQQLEEALSNLRKQMIENIKKQMQELYKQLKEAMASAMSGFFMAAIMAAIIAAIIVALIASIIIAIIVAVVVMMVMMLVKQMIQGMIEKKIEEAKKTAEQKAAKAYEQIDAELDSQRERMLQEMAAAALVDENGNPLTSDSMKAQLQPELVKALKQVTGILDADGPDAAIDQGPQIIHDAMYDELITMNMPHEQADAMAWAITQEAMQNLEDRIGRNDVPPPDDPIEIPDPDPGRHPGDIAGTIVPDETIAQEISDDPVIDPGRHPSEMAAYTAALESSQAALSAILTTPLVGQAEADFTSKLSPELISRLGESLMTNGVEATLRDEVLAERSIAPAAMLGLGAVVSGSLPSDVIAGESLDDLNARDVLNQISEAKDRALEALNSVGEESRLASEQLHRPTSV